MKFHELAIDYYVDRLRRGDFFSFAGYSDAEWYCVLKYDLGKLTGLGQLLDGPTGDKLLDILKRRQHDSNFLFAVPKCMWEWEDFLTAKIGKQIEATLAENDIQLEFYERDMVTDDLAAQAGLYPLIQQLQQMKVVIIGNPYLRGLDFLKYDKFFGVGFPSFHLDEEGIQRVVDNVREYKQPAVYLVSAGISAALIIDKLHDVVQSSFLIDCGSIWDAFVGIGGQRSWRSKLYNNPKLLEKWKHDNLFGKS
jgi:hypothetical protein